MRKTILLLTLSGLLVGCSAPLPEAPIMTPTEPGSSPAPTAGPSATSEPPPTTEPAPAEILTAPPPEPAPPAGPPMARLAPGTPLEIRSIDMQSATVGWALGGLPGEDDHVLRTSDGGATWFDVSPPEPEVTMPYGHRKAIGAFTGVEEAWVAYDHVHPSLGSYSVLVWRTEDQGRTWKPSQPLDLQGLEPDFSPRLMGAVSGSSGWLLVDVGAGMSHEYVVLYTTGDSGETWERVLDPFGDAPIQVCWKTGITFADAQTGWLTRDCRGVADGAFVDVTRDGGRTWESVELLPPDDQPGAFTYPNACSTHSPYLSSPLSGLLGVSCQTYDTGGATPGLSLVYRTQDGGKSWTSSTYPGGDLGLADGRLTWAFNRQIHRTQDDGESWSLVKTVSWDGTFDFVDAENGWAVARDGEETALVRTEDGGSTWQILQPLVAP
jgi:photosystem II stability/assembly factor-like uncharacterized protein